MFTGFSDDRITVSTGITLRVRMAGDGPPLLLLHGYPQTHVCWHKVAPKLVAAGFRVILSDLRGYGDSDRPDSDSTHAPYSKRAMAADQAALMAHLGHARYGVAGHDRGARVTHRLARDFPDRVQAAAVLDIAPTAHMYATTTEAFARAYYHWFFLIQPAPLPERLIGADPEFYLRSKLQAWSKGDGPAFADDSDGPALGADPSTRGNGAGAASGTIPDAGDDPRRGSSGRADSAAGLAPTTPRTGPTATEGTFTAAAVTEYLRCFAAHGGIHASCEDYRAAATIDLEHDAQDAARVSAIPLLALWGDKGVVGRLYDVPAVWRSHFHSVEGAALPCGHFLPEEQPERTAEALIAFFRRHMG